MNTESRKHSKNDFEKDFFKQRMILTKIFLS